MPKRVEYTTTRSASQYTGVGARKSHTKSRNGCTNCKRRRIKCDETKPACANCNKHSMKCDFEQARRSASRALSTPNEPFPSAAAYPDSASPDLSSHDRSEPEEWGLISLKLLQNYSTSTCQSLSDMPMLQDFYRIAVPDIGFSYPFVLQMALATSAIHLSRFDKFNEALYRAEADRRYRIALRAATALMSRVDSDNAHALYVFTNLCCMYTLARGPQPGDFLLFGEQGVVEWLIFFRGLKPIIDSHGQSLSKGVLAPLFQLGIKAYHRRPKFTSEIEPISHLREFISEIASDETCSRALNDALNALSPFFSENDSGSITERVHLQEMCIWLYTVSDDFIVLLRQRQPAALAILAYFCVLTNSSSGHWAWTGWVNHIMQGIYRCLGNEYQLWIRWPIEQIGWIPA